jgi:xanthine dehydrogenase molybdopterin-binding subunit B
MSALENGYKIPNMKITGHICRTNLAPNVAFRGFGVPEAVFLMEYIVDHVASTLHVDPESVCLYNCYCRIVIS